MNFAQMAKNRRATIETLNHRLNDMDSEIARATDEARYALKSIRAALASRRKSLEREAAGLEELARATDSRQGTLPGTDK